MTETRRRPEVRATEPVEYAAGLRLESWTDGGWIESDTVGPTRDSVPRSDL